MKNSIKCLWFLLPLASLYLTCYILNNLGSMKHWWDFPVTMTLFSVVAILFIIVSMAVF